MQVLCPHCQNPIDLADLPEEDVHCPACGSAFRLGKDRTRTMLGERKRLGKFELIERVGAGAFGVVWKAQDTDLGRPVALKIPHVGRFDTERDRERFLREGRSAAQLRHPCIVSTHEVGHHEGLPYLVSDFIDGVTLADFLTARRVSFAEAAELVAQVAEALDYAHRMGVVHRDIKPSNIMLERGPARVRAAAGNGDETLTTLNVLRPPGAVLPIGRPMLMDFGLARRDDAEATMTVEGQVLGTPAYMSPEQAAGMSSQVDARSDVYSLGVVLYQLLTGELPFRGNTRMLLEQVLRDEPRPPRKVNDRIPRDLDTITLKCLAKEPGHRYQTAAELAAELRRWQTGEPIRARPVGRIERLWRWCRRHPGVATLAALVFLLLSAIAGGSLIVAHRISLEVTEKERQREEADRAKGREEIQRKRAEDALEKVEQALRRTDSLRLTAESSALAASNPGQALLLAIEGANRGPRDAASNNALLAAIQACREERTLVGHSASVNSIQLSGTGGLAATGSLDGTARVWDVATGKELLSVRAGGLPVQKALLDPEGERLLVIFAGRKLLKGAGGEEVLVTDQAARIWRRSSGEETAVLRGHADGITAAAYSPDGRHILTTSRDRTARVWDAASGETVLICDGHPGYLRSAVFSPDGRRVMTLSSDQRPRGTSDAVAPPAGMIVDPPANRIPERAQASWVQAEPVEPEENLDPILARIWDLDSRQRIVEIRRPGNALFLTPAEDLFFQTQAARFSADGKEVHIATRMAFIRFSAETGRLISMRRHVPQMVGTAILQPRGDAMLGLGVRDVAALWPGLESGLKQLRGHRAPLSTAAFSPDGKQVATGSQDATARVWSVETGNETAVFRGHEDVVLALEFSPDGRRLATASRDGTARIWSLAPPGGLAQVLAGHGGRILTASFSPDGNWVLTGGQDKTVRLWDAETGKQLQLIKGMQNARVSALERDLTLGEIRQASFDKSGMRIVTASGDANARIQRMPLALIGRVVDQPLPFTPARVFDLPSGKERFGLQGHQCALTSAIFSPDGTRILTASDGRIYSLSTGMGLLANTSFTTIPKAGETTARIWDAATGKELTVLRGHGGAIDNAQFSPDGRLVFTSDRKGGYLWDAASGKQLWKLPAPTPYDAATLETLASSLIGSFSPDGRRLAAAFTRSSLPGWIVDVQTGKETARFSPPAGSILALAFSPDGGGLLAPVSDQTARVWDARTGQPLLVLRGHQREVHQAEYSRDGRWIVTASADETARVWEAATGREYVTLGGHPSGVRLARFDPDSQRVLTVSDDGTARIWPIDPLPAANARKPRELTAAEKDRYGIGP